MFTNIVWNSYGKEFKTIGTNEDSINLVTGIFTQNISDWIELNGSLTWTFDSGTTYKLVYSANAFSGGVAYNVPNGRLCLDYNGTALTEQIGGAVTGANQVQTTATNVYLTIPNTSSGFIDAWVVATVFTGMNWANLLSAYFNGWKLTTANTNVSNCVWTGISSGTTKSGADGLTFVTTNKDAGYRPYKVAYKLAVPVDTQLNKYSNFSNSLRAIAYPR